MERMTTRDQWKRQTVEKCSIMDVLTKADGNPITHICAENTMPPVHRFAPQITHLALNGIYLNASNGRR